MKDEYRKKYLEIRRNIKNKEMLDKNIYMQVINNKHVKESKLIIIYVSLINEIDTFNIIKYFLDIHKQVAVPKIENKKMNFYYITSINELKEGYFHVLEPITNNEVVNFNNCVSITPGICFDKNMYRLGYGKGFYDKFYQKYDNIYKIGLCYKECFLDFVPHDNYDIKVDEIIMPL